MYKVTIITKRPSKDVPFYYRSTPAAAELVAKFTAAMKADVGYAGTTAELSEDQLTATTVDNWASKTAYNKFLTSVNRLATEVNDARDAYQNSVGITRVKTVD